MPVNLNRPPARGKPS